MWRRWGSPPGPLSHASEGAIHDDVDDVAAHSNTTTLRFADDHWSRFPDGHGHDSYVEFGFHDQLRPHSRWSSGLDHDIG